MKVKFSAGSLITASLIGLGSVAAFSNPSYAQSKFFCGTWQGKPTTMVNTKKGPAPMIAWNEAYKVGNLSVRQRCQVISDRFQSFYQGRGLILTSVKNLHGHPVICNVAQVGQTCNKNNVVITLPIGTDNEKVLKQITDFRRGASTKITQLYNEAMTYDNQSKLYYFNVNAILEEDSETKSQKNYEPLF